MRKYAFLAALTLSASVPVSHANHNFIIKFKSPHPSLAMSINSSLNSLGLTANEVKPMAGGTYEVSVHEKKGIKAMDEQTLLSQLNQRSDIEYAVINRRGQFKPLPKQSYQDPMLVLSHELQWDEFSAPEGMMLESAPGKMDGAWAYSLGNAKREVVVAVLDTGLEAHPDLMGNVFHDENGDIYGWNFVANDMNLADETESYHGTHVAGTIAGYGNIMQGVGPSMKILPVKIPAADGMFYESNVVNAIYWAAGADVPGVPKNKHKARVINMSFGVDEHPGKERSYCDQALQEAVDYARQHGVVVVAAAGNDNHWENFNAPAICSGVVRVASTGPSGLRSYFSNYGPSVAFAAPGGDQRYGTDGGILSTVKPGEGYYGSGYDFYQGTSMASPHAAGLFGLVDSASPRRMSVVALEQLLYATTHDFGASSKVTESCQGKMPCGHGIIDALNAISAVSKGFTHFSIPSEAVKKGDPAWRPVSDMAKLQTAMKNAPNWQAKQGQIYAKVNGSYYQFTAQNHQRCEVVGFDGVGCSE
jgi:serine protease